MKKASFWKLFILSAFLLIAPVILEILVAVKVLYENGSTVKDREPVYIIMETVAVFGFIICAMCTPPSKKDVANKLVSGQKVIIGKDITIPAQKYS